MATITSDQPKELKMNQELPGSHKLAVTQTYTLTL